MQINTFLQEIKNKFSKFQSWQIVIMGYMYSILITFFSLAIENINRNINYFIKDMTNESLLSSFFFKALLILFIVLFLRSDKWKKTGAVLSGIMGIIILISMLYALPLILYGSFLVNKFNGFIFFIFELISPLFLIYAGINYFLKKV